MSRGIRFGLLFAAPLWLGIFLAARFAASDTAARMATGAAALVTWEAAVWAAVVVVLLWTLLVEGWLEA